MESIYFCLKYCYGIKSFCDKFIFDDKTRAHIIYAPNGVMKTSFAKTLQDISKEKETKDELYTNRETIRIVKHTDSSGVDYNKDEILVVEPYKEDYSSEKISVLLAIRELKNEYDELVNEIDRKMGVLKSALLRLSSKRTPESIMLIDFGLKANQFYELVDSIYDDLELARGSKFVEIPYGKLFTAEAEGILNKPDIVAQLNSYLDQYKEILTKSVVFHETFDPFNARATLSSLSKSGFFEAKHQVLLNGDVDGRSQEQYAEVIEAESKRIIKEEMLESYFALDKALERVAGTRDLRDFLSKNMRIIPELSNIPLFKKKIWASYLFSLTNQLQEAVLCYRESKKRIAEIIQEAKEKETEWHETVEEFNRRFINLPFTLSISNQEDVVLRAIAPVIEFHIEGESGGEKNKTIERSLLLGCLSDGERRALYLLQIIFELKARQKLDIQTLLVIDDIADSFDYKNKYAIIEYLVGIISDPKFNSIILTHNFDFYRTLATRAEKTKLWFAEKSESDIHLTPGEYTKNVFLTWKEQVCTNQIVFISSIPFLRNLIEYQDGIESAAYKHYTSLLHYKKKTKGDCLATERIFVGTYIDWIVEDWKIPIRSDFSFDEDKAVYTLIMDNANSIAESAETTVKIEFKICLSIAIRLLAEMYMISKIDDDAVTDAISTNQTRKLRNLVEPKLNMPADSEILKLLDRVLIMTSENIHINSFMYEPIIDLSLDELKKLYNEISVSLRL